MQPYISLELGYYEASDDLPISLDSIPVPQRPDPTYEWNSGQWNPSKATINNAIYIQIKNLEDQQTDRRIREAVLNLDNGWLKGVNDQITLLRSQLVP